MLTGLEKFCKQLVWWKPCTYELSRTFKMTKHFINTALWRRIDGLTGKLVRTNRRKRGTARVSYKENAWQLEEQYVALFSIPSSIQNSCRPSFHDTSTCGTREIICMSLKRCHGLTYRAEKPFLLRICGK